MSKSEEDRSGFLTIGSAWPWSELPLEVMRAPLLEVCKHSKAKILQ